MKNKCNMLGRTMFETIAAISIMGLITMGVVKLTNSIMHRYKLSRIGQQVVDIQKAINFRFMADKDGYKKLSPGDKQGWRGILVKEHLVPGEVEDGDNDYGKHAFGGKIYVGPVEGKETYQYYILFENNDGKADNEIWQQACTVLADMKWLQDGTSSLVAHCFGKCDKNAANDLPTSGDCICSFQAPADEKAVEKCAIDYKNLSVLWVFE